MTVGATGIPDEVEEVGEVLYHYYWIIKTLFAYYCTMTSKSVCELAGNAWFQFLRDFRLVSKRSQFCKQSDMDMLIIMVDNASAVHDRNEKKHAPPKTASWEGVPAIRKNGGQQGKSKALDRVEFLFALVNLAINKYVRTKIIVDVSEAVERLFSVDIQAKMGSHLDDPNVFRRDELYSREVSAVLAFHSESLSNIFVGIAGVGGGPGTASLDMDEWLASLRALDFIGQDVTERDAVLCFTWSRLIVTDTTSLRGGRKDSSLSLDGWVEAMCRLAALKALPTFPEIQDALLANGGEYMEMLKRTDSEAYAAFMEERSTPWGQFPTTHPLFHCVAHVVEMSIHTIESHLNVVAGDGVLTQKEVRKWIASHVAKS